MQKMLIAVDSAILTRILKQAYQDKFVIYTCRTGSKALQLLEAVRPDVLIINLFLPEVTGLCVLQRTTFTPTAVFAFTYYVSETVIQEAAVSGVGDILLLPCSVSHILVRLDHLIRSILYKQISPPSQ